MSNVSERTEGRIEKLVTADSLDNEPGSSSLPDIFLMEIPYGHSDMHLLKWVSKKAISNDSLHLAGLDNPSMKPWETKH